MAVGYLSFFADYRGHFTCGFRSSGPIAHLAEHRADNAVVEGSNPSGPTNFTEGEVDPERAQRRDEQERRSERRTFEGPSAAKMLTIRSHFLTLPQYQICFANLKGLTK